LVRERDGVLAKVATGVAVGTAGLAITRLVDRGCEHLADGGGQAIAAEAGFDGEAGARALDKLAHGRGGGLFVTHPSTSSRVPNLQRG
jgi:predicted Zn-dependent protease